MKKTTMILRLTLAVLVGSIGSAFAQSAPSDDSNISPQEIAARQANLRAYFHEREKNLHIVMTRTLPNGEVVDFIPRDPNAPTAPPPAPSNYQPATTDPSGKPLPPQPQQPISWLEKNPALQGPAGTVPSAHYDIEQYLANVKVPAKDVRHMFAPPRGVFETLKGVSAYYYWVKPYIQTGAPNYPNTIVGGFATLNIWQAPGVVYYNDHILSEVALESVNIDQTIETGQMQNPNVDNGNDAPCFFIFFTTDSYGEQGVDWVDGYDTIQKGFVQISTVVYPGGQLAPVSVAGGAQYEYYYKIWYDPHAGYDPHTSTVGAPGWWVTINNYTVGYYPASIFSAGATGLQTGAFAANSWGEIAQASDPTTNGMGSGSDSSYGYGNAAYIRDTGFIYSPTSGGSPANYTFWYWGSADYILPATPTDPNCYSITGPSFGSGNWFNYFFYGGPGSVHNTCKP